MTIFQEIAQLLNNPKLADGIEAVLNASRNNKTNNFKSNGIKVSVFKDSNGDYFITSVDTPNQGKLAAENHATTVLPALKRKYCWIVDDKKNYAVAERDDNFVLTPVSYDSFRMYIGSLAAGTLSAAQVEDAAKWAKTFMCRDHAAECVVQHTDIKPIIWASDPVQPCWTRLVVPEEDRAEPPSAFKELMDRCETPVQALSMAQWIGSLLDLNSGREQYLFIHGQGNDGKSTLCSALIEVFGRRSAKPWSANAMYGAHGTEMLEGVRLVMLQDENGTAFVSSAAFKNLTGDDVVAVNPKGLPMRSVQMHCKFLIASNRPLKLKGDKADGRRAVIVNVRSYTGTDLTFKPRMVAEAADMLQYCWARYKEWKLANPKGALIGDQAALEEAMAESAISAAEHLASKLFLLDPTAFTPVVDFNDYLCRTVSDKTLHDDIKRAAKLLPEVYYTIGSVKGKKMRGYRGLRPTTGNYTRIEDDM